MPQLSPSALPDTAGRGTGPRQRSPRIRICDCTFADRLGAAAMLATSSAWSPGVGRRKLATDPDCALRGMICIVGGDGWHTRACLGSANTNQARALKLTRSCADTTRTCETNTRGQGRVRLTRGRRSNALLAEHASTRRSCGFCFCANSRLTQTVHSLCSTIKHGRSSTQSKYSAHRTGKHAALMQTSRLCKRINRTNYSFSDHYAFSGHEQQTQLTELR